MGDSDNNGNGNYNDKDNIQRMDGHMPKIVLVNQRWLESGDLSYMSFKKKQTLHQNKTFCFFTKGI